MDNKDYNQIAKIEKAIADKYGTETIINPKSLWNEDKEKEYLEQVKELNKKQTILEEKQHKVDFEGVFDYQSAMNLVRAADESFMRMDGKVRLRFNNSPQEFLEFFADPANEQEAIRLGLAIPHPSAVTQVTEEATPSKAE